MEQYLGVDYYMVAGIGKSWIVDIWDTTRVLYAPTREAAQKTLHAEIKRAVVEYDTRLLEHCEH